MNWSIDEKPRSGFIIVELKLIFPGQFFNEISKQTSQDHGHNTDGNQI
jgi:hypothetical protein